MRIGFISDIHANIYAFERVVKEFRNENIDEIVFLGDLVFLGLYPLECYQLLKSLKLRCCIKGNTDSNIEEFNNFKPETEYGQKLYDMIEYTDAKLNSECREDLKRWKIFEKDEAEGVQLIYCHGSPYSFKDKLEESGEDTNRIEDKIKNEDAEIIFCGHTHKKEQFEIGNKTIVNFGAVGFPFDRVRKTRCGIFNIDKEPEFSFLEFDYDIDRYEKDIKASNLFWKEDLLFNLEFGLSGRIFS